MSEEIFDVAIIGSGPAGLTGAIYTSRANLKTLVLAGTKWGGQLVLTTTVENYPGFENGIQGPELMEKMKSQAEKFGAKMTYEDVTSVTASSHPELVEGSFQLKTSSFEYVAKSVVIATGADTKWLGLPNEQRLIGHGVSSCAPCDAFFFKGKKVAVVGGGDAAMEEALVLTKFASSVTIVHRRNAFRASKIMQDRVLSNSKIKILWNTEIIDVLGQEKVEGLVLKNSLEPRTYNLVTDGLFVAIGHLPNSQIFRDLVDVDDRGYLCPSRPPNPSHPSMSRTPGLFIAGDVHDHRYKQAVTAAAFGCMAALDVEKWLDGQK